MIAIKNADGSFVPVLDPVPNASIEIELNWVKEDQEKAEIRLYRLRNGQGALELGVLIIQDLPQNSYGAGIIKLNLAINDIGQLSAEAALPGDKPVRASFSLSETTHTNPKVAKSPKAAKMPKVPKVPNEKHVQDAFSTGARPIQFPYKILAIIMLIISVSQCIAVTLRILKIW